ncbi:hypothetical protein V6M85_02270 [Sulfolobus tengchongensis]|uniref:Uncharacterized protein n=1 Tax=Sulfolobus tengchongensis TaxID=207809 RepID=A0AAX4L2T7_9CREN
MKNVLIISSIIIFILLTLIFFPDTYEFSPYNLSAEGTSQLYNSFQISSSSNVTILLLFENINNVTSYAKYLLQGNTIILSGNYTNVNYFLKEMNITVVIGDTIITNNLDYYMNNKIILYNETNYTLVFPYANPIIGGNPLITINNFTLVACYHYGSGKIIIISTPYFFINKYYGTFNNSWYLHKVASTNKVRIVVYSPDSPLVLIKQFFHDVLYLITIESL